MRIIVRAALAQAVLLFCLIAGADIKFDFGTQKSPVANGYKSVTGTDLYSPKSGYGWETSEQRGFVSKSPKPLQQRPSMTLRGPEIFRENVNDHLVDGVSSQDDMVFRIDVPDGEYRVAVTVGDLQKGLGSLWINCNGKLVARDLMPIHYAGRFMPNHLGFYKTVRFTARAKDETLRIKFFGDDSKYNKGRAHHDKTFKVHEFGWKLEGVPSFLHRKFGDDNGWDVDNLPFDAGAKFERNSVLSIEVRPSEIPLMTWRGAKLVAYDPAADGFVYAVNSLDFEEAERILNDAKSVKPIKSGMAYMFLLGHPDSPNDREAYWIEEARKLLGKDDAGPLAEEYLEDLEQFARA